MEPSNIEIMREVVAYLRRHEAEEAAKKGEQAVQHLRALAIEKLGDGLVKELNAKFDFDGIPWMTISYRGQTMTVLKVPSTPELADWMDQVDELLAVPRILRPVRAWLRQRRER